MQNTIIKRMPGNIYSFDSYLDYRIFSEHSQHIFAAFSEPINRKGVKVTETKNIFDNISKRADEKGLSINALEEKSGIASGSVYKWKTVSPTVRSISKVAAVLGCSVDDLIT